MDVYEAIATRRTVRDFEDKPVEMSLIERVLDAGLKAPSNNHLRQWEFVIINDREERAKVLRVKDMTSRDECDNMLDGFGLTDEVQRNMYHEAMPRQFSMLSSLNDFASIWCCIENILLASASEGIFGVTRIPMAEESAHIQEVIGHPDNYVMPCYIALGYPAKNASRPKQKHIQVKEKIHMHTW